MRGMYIIIHNISLHAPTDYFFRARQTNAIIIDSSNACECFRKNTGELLYDLWSYVHDDRFTPTRCCKTVAVHDNNIHNIVITTLMAHGNVQQ